MMLQTAIEDAVDHYEIAVEKAVATCGGDLRGALKALILANEFLEAELSALHATARGSVSTRRAGSIH